MYTRLTSDLRLAGGSVPFENRALLNAVRHISNNLVRQASLNISDRRYANLLSDILGQSHYATIEVLAQKRRESAQQLARKRREFPAPVSSVEDTSSFVVKKKTQKDVKQAFSSKTRDKLVKMLRAARLDESSMKEHTLTLGILDRDGVRDVEALRRLWGIPKVVFEATRLDRYLNEQDVKLVRLFYERRIWRMSSDARIFNILYWKESCWDRKHDPYDDPCHPSKRTVYHPPRKPPDGAHAFRTVSKAIIADVVKALLTKRRSLFFERNMDVVIETVMYAINPDRFVERFRETALRDAGFFKGLHGYEYSRSFTGSLENLHMGKLNRMLKDIKAVRNADSSDRHSSSNTNCLSLRAIRKYCSERDLLTDRAIKRVYERYVRHRSRRGYGTAEDMRFSVGDFVRMYLAWVGCWTDPGLKYWFSILDQDGDGWVGVGDVVHFYSERRFESERRNGMLLADAHCLWFRLCSMSRVSPNGPGIDLQALMDLGKEEREFVMNALLVRRADDGHLTNVEATMKAHQDSLGSTGLAM